MKVFRYTPRSFARAVEAGVFGDQKVELLGGVPHLMTTNPPHIYVVRRLAGLLAVVYPADHWTIYEEKFVKIGSWMPQPDISVIRSPASQYLPRLAEPADIRLVVEVSDMTYALDRGKKYRRYAAAGIPEYWIVNLNDQFVQVFRDPEGSGKTAQYRSSATSHEGEAIGAIAVADILPPKV
ncbi:MAG: Uma2 family endonuclease [Isosphaeraceae bacterium]|nr:Uma2 family endonuclease [Isosphaeraceae bacterium]